MENLKVVLSATVQSSLCHFLPYTPEGESFRWDVGISPDAPGFDLLRADKLVPKDGSLRFLSTLLATQVIHILGGASGCTRLQADGDTRGIEAAMEKCGRTSYLR